MLGKSPIQTMPIDFFRPLLASFINLHHELIHLGNQLGKQRLESHFVYCIPAWALFLNYSTDRQVRKQKTEIYVEGCCHRTEDKLFKERFSDADFVFESGCRLC